MLPEPRHQHVVGAALLVVLRLGKGHYADWLAVLVGEYYHQALAREISRKLLGEALKSRLVRYCALTGGDDDEQVVVVHLAGKARHINPMRHIRVFGADAWVSVLHVSVDERQRLALGMEADTAVEVLRHTRQTLQPTVETRLELGARGHRNVDKAYRVERP